MLREMFPEVSRDEVVRRLERCKGDMDAAVLSLLELTDMNYKEESQTHRILRRIPLLSIRSIYVCSVLAKELKSGAPPLLNIQFSF